MGTQNFAYGNSMFQDLPYYDLAGGIQTEFGTILPPGSRVAAYVRSTGYQDLDPKTIQGQLVLTLADALARSRAGFGDIIILLPGHSESISSATYLSALTAGTRIIGAGRGSNMPTLRLTATSAQLAIAVADVVFSGIRFRLEGANGIVKAINVTGADVLFQKCDFEVGSGASNKATIALEVGSGGNGCTIAGCRFRGVTAGAVTDGILIAAAVSEFRAVGNTMMFAGTNGLIRCTAAATNLYIGGNVMENLVASSVACINFSNVAADGVIADNYMVVKNATTVTGGTTGITVGGSSNLVGFFNNQVVNSVNASGILTPAADT